MKNNENVDKSLLQPHKKWCQLKKKEQIVVSTILRDLYIRFVLENKRKPNKNEKQFIVASVYLELEETNIFIPAKEMGKYFESKIPNYDKSIVKLQL